MSNQDCLPYCKHYLNREGRGGGVLKQGLLAVNSSANIRHSGRTPPAIFTINYQWQAYS